MVETDNAKAGLEVLEQQGIDVTTHIMSVEESAKGMKKVVRMAVVRFDILEYVCE